MKHLKKEVVEKRQYQKKIRVGIPGVQTLHLKSPEDIGKALSDAFVEESGVVEMKYVLGKYIELTIDNTPPDNTLFKQEY